MRSVILECQRSAVTLLPVGEEIEQHQRAAVQGVVGGMPERSQYHVSVSTGSWRTGHHPYHPTGDRRHDDKGGDSGPGRTA